MVMGRTEGISKFEIEIPARGLGIRISHRPAFDKNALASFGDVQPKVTLVGDEAIIAIAEGQRPATELLTDNADRKPRLEAPMSIC